MEPGLVGHIGEGAIAIVAKERVLPVVADEEIVPAVVVVVADAASLSPSAARQAGFDGDIGEGAVAIIFEEVADRLLPLGEAFQSRAIDQEDIEPVILVVVIESDAAAGGFEQVLVLVFAAVDGLGVEAGLAAHVGEAHAQWSAGDRRRLARRRGPRGCVVRRPGTAHLRATGPGNTQRMRQREHVFKRKNQSSPGERTKETAATPDQRVGTPALPVLRLDARRLSLGAPP